LPDISEPRQAQEKRHTKHDALANRPALALGYHVPERNTPEYWAMGLLDQILLQGDDAWLHQALVQQEGATGSVSGGINLLGNMFNYDGPMLWTVSLIHDADKSVDRILQVADSVIERASTELVDAETLERAKVKMRSQLYDEIDRFFGFGRADLLASFALFDDDPSRISQLEDQFSTVTPALVQQTAAEYLRSTNRTILFVEPGAATTVGAGGVQ
jgi:predicted Zn-dependent peptidase